MQISFLHYKKMATAIRCKGGGGGLALLFCVRMVEGGCRVNEYSRIAHHHMANGCRANRNIPPLPQSYKIFGSMQHIFYYFSV